MSKAQIVDPGGWLGLLGGGQLGRMFAMAAQRMGYRVVVLDPDERSPAGAVADRHLRADYLDAGALEELARLAAAVTIEFENVPARALEFLAGRCRVAPGAEAVAIAQDRIAEKRFIRSCGIPVAPFAEVTRAADLERVDPALLPGILKVARLGYDGKGQVSVADAAAARAAFAALGAVPCVLERRLDLAREISVVVARRAAGDYVHFPVAENEHVGGILDMSIVPARVPHDVAAAAARAAEAIAERLDYVGVLCVEFFVLRAGELVANEMAPRPHNSGHYSLDACITSQFEQQARILAGLPLGSTALHAPAVMVNLLGEAWADGEPDWTKVLRHPTAKLHLYGKAAPRPGRKMGHYTVLAPHLETALETALAIRRELGFREGR